MRPDEFDEREMKGSPDHFVDFVIGLLTVIVIVVYLVVWKN